MSNYEAVRRGDQVRRRSTWQILRGKLKAKIGDYPILSSTLLLLLVLYILDAEMWLLVSVMLVCVVAMVYLRDRTKARRRKRRTARWWRGTPEVAGAAANLGLINASGQPPIIRSYKFSDDGLTRSVAFDLPTGITGEDMTLKTVKMADAFGALRASFTKIEPRRVELLLIDADTISQARDAAWLGDVEDSTAGTLKEEAGGILGDTRPWWEQEKDLPFDKSADA